MQSYVRKCVRKGMRNRMYPNSTKTSMGSSSCTMVRPSESPAMSVVARRISFATLGHFGKPMQICAKFHSLQELNPFHIYVAPFTFPRHPLPAETSCLMPCRTGIAVHVQHQGGKGHLFAPAIRKKATSQDRSCFKLASIEVTTHCTQESH